MCKDAGMIKPELEELPQISDRMTFIYLEHCTINREDRSICWAGKCMSTGGTVEEGVQEHQ